MRAIMLVSMLIAVAACATPVSAQSSIEAVVLHRVFAQYYTCGDHFEGELQYAGDALGTDCLVQGGLENAEEGAPMFARAFRGDGLRNEDWYGLERAGFAPFDGAVVRVNLNAVTNQPGYLGSPPASFVVFERADGVRVLYAHVQDVQVAEGDTVRAGQPFARVGNNGYGRTPHIHVGAWKDEEFFQIRWDLRSGTR